MGLSRKKRQLSPSGSGSATTPATPSAYELHNSHLSRLHRAAARGDLPWLRRWRWWLKMGGINRRDRDNRTPLHLACANGHADVVQFLVQENCQLNLADNFQRSPLMKAVQCQQEECVAILLEHGADPNLPDALGNTALHLAVQYPSRRIVRLLLEHNANTNAQNQEGYSPLNLAGSRHRQEMMEFLHKTSSDGHAQDQHERLEETVHQEGSQAQAPQEDLQASVSGMVTQLQQDLSDALKKQSLSEACLEVTTRYCRHLEEEKFHLQQELEKAQKKVQELEEQHLQSEHAVQEWKFSLSNKERELRASSRELQDLQLTSSGANARIKQLEEHVHHLETENARLEATVQQQNNRIEALHRDLQATASVHDHLEKLITSLQAAQAAVENHYRQQCENERNKVKKLVELKHSVELRLNQEMERNIELQKDCKRLKRFLSRAMKKLRLYEERDSHLSLQGEMKNGCSEIVPEVGTLRMKPQEASKDPVLKIQTVLDQSHHQFKDGIKDLQSQLDNIKNTLILERESLEADVKKHKERYMEEVESQKRLEKILERANQEIRHYTPFCRNMIGDSLQFQHLQVDIQLKAQKETHQGPEASVARMQQETYGKIPEETEQANADLKKSSAQVPAVLSAYTADQDPLQMATNTYHDVLLKNYKI